MSTISIEGNIGAGKSSLVRYLEKSSQLLDATFYPEPVEEWKNFHGHNMLDVMYRDMNKYAMVFQVLAYNTMKRIRQKPFTTRYKILERSVETTVFCFSKLQLSLGNISPIEKLVIEHMYETDSLSPMDRVFYLKTDPSVCHERLKRRDRSEESGISLDYLCKLHKVYDEYIQSCFGDKVTIINGNSTKEDIRSQITLELLQ